MKKILLVVMVLALGVIASAQNYSVSGKVIDKETGRPLVGAHIVAYPSQKVAVTNFDGGFSLKKLTNKDTLLKVTMVGYKAISSKLQHKNQEVNFELDKEVGFFSEVVVTGTRTLKTLGDTPILTKVVTEEQIRTSGANTALDALEFAMPGVTFERDPHTTLLSIQGLENQYILILINGQRITGETLDQVNMKRINADDIEKIEVLGGAASVLYGSNAVSSVVNIITKKNKEKWEGSVGVRFSPENKDLNNDITLGHRTEKLDIRFNGFRRSSDGYKLKEDSENLTEAPNVDYSARLAASYEISKNIKINAHGRYFQSDYESIKPKDPKHKLVKNQTYGIGAELKPSSKHLVVLKANTDYAKQIYTHLKGKDDIVNAKNRFSTLSFLDTYTCNSDVQFVLGVDYNKASVFSKSLFAKGPETKSISDLNAFIQTDYKILPTLDFIVGLRYTNHENFGGHYTPKFSLMQKWGNFKFRGNLSWGYKTPTLKHMYYNFSHGSFWIKGNPDLTPEKSFYKSFSVEYGKTNFNISANFFHNKLEDKISGFMTIDKAKGTRLYTYENFASVKIRGIETFVNVRLLQNITSQIGYNFLDAKDLTTGRQLMGTSKHYGTCGLTWSDAKMKNPIAFNISGRVHSKRYYNQRKKNKIIETYENGYFLWKATYSQDFKIYNKFNLKFQLGVDNVFDYKKNETVLNPGRTFWGALRLYL